MLEAFFSSQAVNTMNFNSIRANASNQWGSSISRTTILLALLCLHSSKCSSAPNNGITTGLVPDTQTRKSASLIAKHPIKSIQFYGPPFGCFADDPVVVRDPAITRQFIAALRVAETRPLGIADRVGTMVVTYGLPRHKADSVPFDMNPSLIPDSFGPPFRRALLSLQSYKAFQLSHTIMSIDKQVVSLRVGNTVIADARSKKRIIKWLEDANPDDFAYTTSPANKHLETVQMTLINAKTKTMNFVLTTARNDALNRTLALDTR